MMKADYRPEIDGLRAIAVSCVIIFHAEFFPGSRHLLAGGYVGVDVFFVISGYLITLIIHRELIDGRFSLARFYERRARRILPPLLLAIAAALPLAWIYMLPKATLEFAGSGLSALFFGSNIWFWKEDSYTAEASMFKPLLHTWTLSVEEQFYLLYPMFLIALWKLLRSHVLTALLVALFLSLALAEVVSGWRPVAAFYLLATRGWELLAGAVLARLELQLGRSAPPALAAALPPIGLLLIASAAVVFSDPMFHPALTTTVVVAGTMCVIWFAQPGHPATRLLSSRPFVAIGLISYSLYIWHFPLFAFARIRQTPLSTLQKFEVIALTVALAAITYLLVERPVRFKKWVTRRRLVAGLAVAYALTGGVLAYYWLTDGAYMRLGPLVGLFERAERETLRNDKSEDCFNLGQDRVPNCAFVVDKDARTLVIAGDSHGPFVFGTRLLKLARKRNLNYVELGLASCPFVIGVHKVSDAIDEARCKGAVARWHKYLRRIPPSTVVLSARWPLYLTGMPFDNKEGGVELVKPQPIVSDQAGEPVEARIRGTIELLLALGHQVVLIYPIPEVGFDVPKTIRAQLRDVPPLQLKKRYEQIHLTTSLPVYEERTASTFAIFESLGTRDNLFRVYPHRLFCSADTRRCITHDTENILYMDDQHVSPPGAAMIVAEIERVLFGGR